MSVVGAILQVAGSSVSNSGSVDPSLRDESDTDCTTSISRGLVELWTCTTFLSERVEQRWTCCSSLCSNGQDIETFAGRMCDPSNLLLEPFSDSARRNRTNAGFCGIPFFTIHYSTSSGITSASEDVGPYLEGPVQCCWHPLRYLRLRCIYEDLNERMDSVFGLGPGDI
ncbi:hypothetical protein Tsubulata_047797 [Turnera subulata]|uniref:Uncharacterized protein n=1 Tax=Turnera subulata TaxID=218843 RepID=A0A9Q0F1X4_9ROSI|nr:hypothetical protein Tsubulata_047797 [Turnera subulata]